MFALSNNFAKANFDVRYGDEKIELSLRRLYFGDVDVKEANRIGFKLLLRGLVAFNVRQPADPVPLQAAVQR
jgi:hypothetical protein